MLNKKFEHPPPGTDGFTGEVSGGEITDGGEGGKGVDEIAAQQLPGSVPELHTPERPRGVERGEPGPHNSGSIPAHEKQPHP